jgi:hypothetical protein
MSTGCICYDEITAALLHLCEPQVPLSTLLSRCVAKGLPYRIYMPSTYIQTVNNRGMHNFDSGTPNHYLIQQGRGKKVSERMVKQYYDMWVRYSTVLTHVDTWVAVDFYGASLGNIPPVFIQTSFSGHQSLQRSAVAQK